MMDCSRFINFPRFKDAITQCHRSMWWKKVEVEIANSIRFYSSPSSKRRVTDTPLKQRQPRFDCFLNKKNESLGVLSINFRCLAGSANKDCVSSKVRTL